MSNTSMLEQAIVDAETLKETALKSAESTILEKYSSEVKEAIDSLLEQDMPDIEDPLGFDADESLEEDVEEQFNDVPNAHYQKDEIDEDQEVNIDLDKLAEELKKEGGDEIQEDTEDGIRDHA